MTLPKRTQYLFKLLNDSISLSDEERNNIKAYVVIKDETVESFIVIFEREQEKIQEIEREFTDSIEDALANEKERKIEEEENKKQMVAKSMRNAIQHIKDKELKNQEDADEYLDDMLNKI